MKKLKIIVFSVTVLFGVSLKAQDLPISSSELPVPAVEFINKHFSSQTIQSAIKDLNHGGVVEFEVRTNKQVKIEFNQLGEWKEVESQNQEGLPVQFLPENIRQYLKDNYSKEKIEKVEKNARGYEIELMNDLGLRFNLKGEFLYLED